MIVGISGKLKSGKDSVTDQILIFSRERYYITKFAAKLKQMVAVLIDCEPEKLEDQDFKQQSLGKAWNGLTPRYLLQTLGTDWGRNLYDKIWVTATMSSLDPDKNYVINDVRFENEAEAIKQAGGLLIRVNRPGIESNNHASETALDNYTGWDYVIENDGTLFTLQDKVKDMVIKLGI